MGFENGLTVCCLITKIPIYEICGQLVDNVVYTVYKDSVKLISFEVNLPTSESVFAGHDQEIRILLPVITQVVIV